MRKYYCRDVLPHDTWRERLLRAVPALGSPELLRRVAGTVFLLALMRVGEYVGLRHIDQRVLPDGLPKCAPVFQNFPQTSIRTLKQYVQCEVKSSQKRVLWPKMLHEIGYVEGGRSCACDQMSKRHVFKMILS